MNSSFMQANICNFSTSVKCVSSFVRMQKYLEESAAKTKVLNPSSVDKAYS